MWLLPAVLFLHIAFVLVLFLTFGVEWTNLVSLRGASTADQIRRPATTIAALGRLYSPCGAGIALTGIYLALILHVWMQAWIIVALVSVLLMAIDGWVMGGRRVVELARRVLKTTARLPEELQRQLSDPALVVFVRIRAGATMGLLFLMVMKPGWLGSLTAMAVGITVGWIVGGRSSAAGRQATGDPIARIGDTHRSDQGG